MTASTLDSRLRQIAILVASVDTTAARQLLMHLPTEIAKRVRAMAADIGPVPPEERRALLEEFQRSQAQLSSSTTSTSNPGPSANNSSSNHHDLTAKAFAEFAAQSSSANYAQPKSPSWTRLGVDALVRLVRLERPTVIAVVLQQLPATQVAAVLQRLPRSTTKETLQALGTLQDIDEDAMRAIDEHLSERLRDYHHKIETELEQTRRMNELLSAAPPEMKQQWASWMRPDLYLDEDAASASSGPISATASAMNTLDNLYKSTSVTTNDSQWASVDSTQSNAGGATAASAPNLNRTAQPPNAPGLSASINSGHAAATKNSSVTQQATTDEDGPHTIPFPGTKSRETSQESQLADRIQLQKNMESILTLAPERLAQFLSSLDSQTILLALAGASTQFMKRFREMLEPDDAKALDERIQRIGPITLRQIDEAQQRLVSSYQALLRPVDQSRASLNRAA